MFPKLFLLLLICTFVCAGDGTVQHCEAGTHGAMAGAPTVALGCPSCPAGSVSGSPSSAACEACVAPLVASPNVQTCVSGLQQFTQKLHPPPLVSLQPPSFANGAPRLGFCTIAPLSCPPPLEPFGISMTSYGPLRKQGIAVVSQKGH